MDLCPHSDQIFGLNEPISRRSFVDGMLVASTVRAAYPSALGAQSPAGWSGYDPDMAGAEGFDDFSRSATVRKNATFGVNTDGVGPDPGAVLTFCVDFTKPRPPARTQGHLGRAELLWASRGHPSINSQPAFCFGWGARPAAREAFRKDAFGGIAFSPSDLAGAVAHRNAFMESPRGAHQPLDRVLT